MNKIDDVDEETFRDAKSIIELLKENLTLWKEEEGENNIEDLWVWSAKHKEFYSIQVTIVDLNGDGNPYLFR